MPGPTVYTKPAFNCPQTLFSFPRFIQFLKAPCYEIMGNSTLAEFCHKSHASYGSFSQFATYDGLGCALIINDPGISQAFNDGIYLFIRYAATSEFLA